jgi:phage virion morphogenesis protein
VTDGPVIKIELDDFQLQAIFTRLMATGVSMRPLWSEISSDLERTTRARWDAGQAPDGSPWEPLQPATLRRKARKGYTPDVLKATGDLYGRLVQDYGDDYAGLAINRVDAALHQFGGTDDMPPGPAGVPARPIFGLTDADRAEILDAASEYLLAQVVSP